MKSKRNTYILLVLVLLIWGAVIYRFFDFTSQPQIVEDEGKDLFLPKKTDIKEREKNIINTNYRDPFLGKVYSDKPKEATGGKKPKKNHNPEAAIPLPNIVYKGSVSDTKSKNKVFMLVINGHTYLLRVKDTEEGVTLVKGNGTEITIVFKGKTHTIVLQQ